MSVPRQSMEAKVFGCWMAIFGSAAWFISLVGIVLSSLGPPQELGGTRISLLLHHAALWSPFLWMGWGFGVAAKRRLWPRATGLAVVRATDNGWAAVLPSVWALVFASALFTALIFATGMLPLYLLGKRNPWWVWAIAWPVAGFLAWRLYQRINRPSIIVIDDATETVTFPRGRRQPPLTVAWRDVVSMETVLHEGDSESGDDYVATVIVRMGDQVETLYLGQADHELPVTRFVAWLRERLGKR